MRFHHKITGTVFLTLLCAAASVAAGSTEKRVLIFPHNVSLGSLHLMKMGPEIGGVIASTGERTMVGVAQDKRTIDVPAGSFLRLTPSGALSRDPSLFKLIPATGIDALRIPFVSMEDSEDGNADKAVENIKHMVGLKSLDLDRSEVSDRGLEALVPLKQLVQLTAFGARVKGECLKSLNPALESLNLTWNPVQTQNLALLKRFPKLRLLGLSSVNLTHKGMEYISACSNLTTLRIATNPSIGDQEIPLILKLKNLRTLDIRGCSFTPAGICKLTPLKLKFLYFQSSSFKPADVRRIQAAFKDIDWGAQVDVRPPEKEPVKDLFAPLH